MFLKSFFLFNLFFSSLYALEFRVASYNPENLFDLHLDGTEYDEYKPNSETWNRKGYETKLKNVAKVLMDLKADIVVLEEIENRTVLLELLKKVKYSYFIFDKKPEASVGIAIISKFPILGKEVIFVPSSGERERNILKATIQIEDKRFIVYGNHWRSKRTTESKRVNYAIALQNHLKTKGFSDDYVIAGDLNSNYDEFITFKYDETLNDTYGITGINQVLNTVIKGNFVTKEDIFNYSELIHFNPWLEIPKEGRFSLKFRNENGTPDNIILSKNLFDNNGISYIPNSFNVFKPQYLFATNGAIKRWNSNKKDGFSDHLPIFAHFTTNKISNKNYTTQPKNQEIKEKEIKSIKDIYTIATLNDSFKLKNVLVTYKSNKLTILKGSNNDRSIQYYNTDNIFELGTFYDIEVFEVDDYYGAKEIKKLEILSKNGKVSNIKDSYLNGFNIDLDNSKYQNEVITNLKGIYKKGYLHYQNGKGSKKIKLYFKKDMEKPKDGLYFVLESGILSTYKSKNQILINKDTDYKIYLKR